jgi:hypothetical protein
VLHEAPEPGRVNAIIVADEQLHDERQARL